MDIDPKSILEHSLEVQSETLGVLRGIETMLDQLITVAEDIEDAAAELAWRSLPFYVRWHQRWLSRKNPVKLDIVLDGSESHADGIDPHT